MKRCLSACALSFLSWTSPAASEELRLEDVLTQVATEHPLILAAEAQVDEANGYALAARGAFDLQTEAEGSHYPLGQYDRTYGTLGLRQPTTAAGIQLWGRYENGAGYPPYQGGSVTSEWGRLSAGILFPLLQGRAIDPARLNRYIAEAKTTVSREEQRQTQAQLLSAAARAWWSWLIAGKKLKAHQELAQQAEFRQAFIEEQVRSGAEPQVELDDNNRVLAQRLAKLTEVELAFVEKSLELGLFRRNDQGVPAPGEPDELPPLPHFRAKQPPLQTEDAQALTETPRMRIYDISLDILEREIRGAKNKALPKLDFEVLGSQSVGATRPYSQFDDSITETTLGAKLKFGWDVQRREARGKQAALRARHRFVQQKRRFDLEKARLRFRAQVAALQAQFRAAQLSQQATEHAGKVSDAERISFELGQSSVLAVNLREQAYLSTYIAELESILAFQLAWLAQRELLGRTDPNDYLPPGNTFRTTDD